MDHANGMPAACNRQIVRASTPFRKTRHPPVNLIRPMCPRRHLRANISTGLLDAGAGDYRCRPFRRLLPL